VYVRSWLRRIALSIGGLVCLASTAGQTALPPLAAASIRTPAGASSALVQAFPDFLALRSELLSQVITANPTVALRFPTTQRTTPNGPLRITVERVGDVFYVMFLYGRDGAFPYSARGNIIIKRAANTGYIQAIKWLLSDDGRSYLYLTPNNERTLIDYVVDGVVVNRGLTANTLIYYFLLQPFSFLHDSLRAQLNWRLVLAERGPAASLTMMDAIAELPANRVQADAVEPEAALLYAAANPEAMEAYLRLVNQPVDSFRELTVLPLPTRIASSDERGRGTVVDNAAWSASAGFPAGSLRQVVGLWAGRAFLLLEASGRYLVIPWQAANGNRELFIWDLTRHQPLPIGSTPDAWPTDSFRLFEIPMP